jgi:hypothetical protein
MQQKTCVAKTLYGLLFVLAQIFHSFAQSAVSANKANQIRPLNNPGGEVGCVEEVD